MTITPRNPFKGHHYSGEVILLAVRWYLRYPVWSNIRVRERVYDGCSSCQRTKWLGCWPTSPGWSIRNSYSRMNTSQPRIASSEPNFPPVCVFRIPNDQPLLRSVSDSAVLRFSRLPVWPSPIPSSPGTGGTLPANWARRVHACGRGGRAHPARPDIEGGERELNCQLAARGNSECFRKPASAPKPHRA